MRTDKTPQQVIADRFSLMILNVKCDRCGAKPGTYCIATPRPGTHPLPYRTGAWHMARVHTAHRIIDAQELGEEVKSITNPRGAGRKPLPPGKRMLKRSFSISQEHYDDLLKLGGGNLSAGLKKLMQRKR